MPFFMRIIVTLSVLLVGACVSKKRIATDPSEPLPPPRKILTPVQNQYKNDLSRYVLETFELAEKNREPNPPKLSMSFVAKLKSSSICTFSVRGRSGSWSTNQVLGSAILSPEQKISLYPGDTEKRLPFSLHIERGSFVLMKDNKKNRDVLKITPGPDRLMVNQLDNERDTKFSTEVANGADVSVVIPDEGQAVDCQSMANFVVRRILARTEPRTRKKGFRFLNPELMSSLELRELTRISQMDKRELKQLMKKIEGKQFDFSF
ncbi:MAG: hypothetical protein AB7O96_18775 [Pseudobdellovibrionaceae bacterium]